jgi:hypothetical protein
MTLSDEHLFWLVLLSFWVVENGVLLPSGSDYLRVSSRGRIRYDPAQRLQVLGRDLVFSNPLNPFDRILVTSAIGGPIQRAAYKELLQTVKLKQAPSDLLSWIGCIYLLMLVLHLGASTAVHFGSVLMSLLACHVLLLVAVGYVVMQNRSALMLTPVRVAGLLLELLLVPGYMPNIGKRLWAREKANVPALAIGLRVVSSKGRDDLDVLSLHRLSARLSEYALTTGYVPGTESSGQSPSDTLQRDCAMVASGHLGSSNAAANSAWIEEAELCLKTLVPTDG